MPTLSLKECKRKTAGWIVEACDDDDDSLLIFADILHRSVPRLLSATNSNNVEDTFVHNAVTDLLDVVFGEDQKLCHEWANKKLPGTEASVLMKPDFMAATKPSHRVVYLFSVEIKPPSKTRDDDVCEDRVKLGVQMKAMLQVPESLRL
ncbi:hypothetical protein BJV82DRAFT_714541 [Fennellomyces sp. T-0311]|nr:hypothetical protein BJV82DRAFT_714541 [Fennellomyces sp. T-0311]